MSPKVHVLNTSRGRKTEAASFETSTIELSRGDYIENPPSANTESQQVLQVPDHTACVCTRTCPRTRDLLSHMIDSSCTLSASPYIESSRTCVCRQQLLAVSHLLHSRPLEPSALRQERRWCRLCRCQPQFTSRHHYELGVESCQTGLQCTCLPGSAVEL